MTASDSPMGHAAIFLYQVQAGRAAGATAVTVNLPASARSVQASTTADRSASARHKVPLCARRKSLAMAEFDSVV